MKSEIVNRIRMKIGLKTKLKISNQMAFISLITDMGYREDKMWSDEDEHILHKICKLADQHTQNQLELIEKHLNDFRVVEVNEQGYPEIIEYKYKGKWLKYVNFDPETELKLNQYVKDNLK